MIQARNRRWRWQSVALAVPLVFLSACGEGPQSALRPAGEWSRKVGNLFNVAFFMAVVVFIVVEGLLVYFLVRFRARPGDDEPKQIHGATRLEIAWTIVPALMLAGLAVPTVATVFDLARTPRGDVLAVKVTGHQWWWEFEYPQTGVKTASELHIPVKKQVNVELRSFDVIHSFWVPRLAGKLDVVPGHVNRLTLEADKPGVYLGQCAEFCGRSHANMRLRVVAQTQQEFDAWIRQQQQPAAKPTSGLAAEGYALWGQKGCAACHSIAGNEASGGANVGPNLTHLQSRSMFAGDTLDLTPENLTKWLRNPSALKPMQPENGIGMPSKFPPGPNGKPLTDDEIAKLVSYLETLK